MLIAGKLKHRYIAYSNIGYIAQINYNLPAKIWPIVITPWRAG